MDVRATLTRLLRDGFILVFNRDELDVVETARAVMKAGLGNMEVTCRIGRPLDKIRRLRAELSDLVIGAASLIDHPRMLEAYNAAHDDDPLPCVAEAFEAGADFLVSAGNFREQTFTDHVGRAAVIPGCGSVSEILSQFALGANLVKVFPAAQLGGPAFIKAIDPAVHKTISLVPMGGTGPDNIGDYVEAGVLVLGGSFSAIGKENLKRVVEKQDYSLLAAELARIKKLLDECRRKKWPKINFTDATVEQVSSAAGRNFNLD